MAVKILSGTCNNLKGAIIEVEVNITKGMPYFNIVGLPDTSVRESKERVRTAIINNGYKFPMGRITVNLAPADEKKIGGLLDLPIALAILMESNQIKRNEEYIVIGELSLSGDIKGVKGVLPIIISSLECGINKFIMPINNNVECKFYTECEYYLFSNLKGVISFIDNKDSLPYEYKTDNKLKDKYDVDFSQIIGQEQAKRALLISAIGKHNIDLYGSTGCGKTMLAKAINSILPKLSEKEELEVAKIYSAMGLIKKGFEIKRPFRNPYNTITKKALLGGGYNITYGEITLAHKGVLLY